MVLRRQAKFSAQHVLMIPAGGLPHGAKMPGFDMMKDVGAQGKTAAVFMNSGDGLSDGVARGFMSGLPAAPGFAQPMGR